MLPSGAILTPVTSTPALATAFTAAVKSRCLNVQGPRLRLGVAGLAAGLEPRRRQLGIAHGVLNVPVAEVGLQGPRVVPLVRQRVAAGVPEHVRVRLEAQLCLGTRPLDHAGEASSVNGAPRSDMKTKGDLGLLLALKAPQSA
jgi:hypothetical protein